MNRVPVSASLFFQLENPRKPLLAAEELKNRKASLTMVLGGPISLTIIIFKLKFRFEMEIPTQDLTQLPADN